ncbi:hypothetical protein EDD21DRAFT_449139 [Dissophora ornata]|nr:hypothetical protein EDD21DRAFT_449139 [Dissophora ornata]
MSPLKRQCIQPAVSIKRVKMVPSESTLSIETSSVPSSPAPHLDGDDVDQMRPFVHPTLQREDAFYYPQDSASQDKGITHSNGDPWYSNQAGDAHQGLPSSLLNQSNLEEENMPPEAPASPRVLPFNEPAFVIDDRRKSLNCLAEKAAKESLENMMYFGEQVRSLSKIYLDKTLTAEYRLFCKLEMGSAQRKYVYFGEEFRRLVKLAVEARRSS